MEKAVQLGEVNATRYEAIVQIFRRNKGRKVFILTEAFPFMFIGIIKDVVEDYAVLDVQVTSIPALERKEWLVHVDKIEVFYFETELGPKIPDLKD
ncbi:hypothetical protein QT711_14595 [Sporosarcina saromensis]|uniref:Uncharacterized protein n=1 Tax=Sporosarcina saromensis TaxID=359365 RepID=A0ABU4GBQ0_9BACL|nr:hypothetical protein [Sporosarcina saromensis]MDW0114424.1 hypothetical protein [Sporosarcina saromensis]